MKSRRARLLAPLSVLLLLPLLVASRGGAQPDTEPIELADASMIIEINDTDGDAGIQVFADGDPWRRMKVSAPDGRKIIDLKARTSLRDFGLTELFSESNEPPFDELPFDEFKQIWPEGTYQFRARTIDGVLMTGSAMLSHAVPDGPTITFPEDEATESRNGFVVRWDPVTKAGVEIEGYQVLVINEDRDREYAVELGPRATRIRVPKRFLVPGDEHKVEVLAVATNGNQTITEHTFTIE